MPEFEPEFQAELEQEDGEMGSFQAMSLLARWAERRLGRAPDADAVRRVFGAVERLIVDSQFNFGDALAAEFIEATWSNPAAVALMGPTTRERAEAP